MICHGGSSPKAIMNAIRMAHEYVARQVNDRLVSQLDTSCAVVVNAADGAAGGADNHTRAESGGAG
jgi:glycerol-3-phosphate acyltransferase PlsX